MVPLTILNSKGDFGSIDRLCEVKVLLLWGVVHSNGQAICYDISKLVYQTLVCIFYSNMLYKLGPIILVIKGVTIELHKHDIFRILDVPFSWTMFPWD